ncbi:phosphopantetheine-binding protein [Streptomyces sp. NPDC048514]|uniref:phosphopantetheine-binding protein n=1 Tax=Streptomyces sp. NPDC048514 TaxID=3365564 RepID=UPI00371A504B
MAAGVSTVDEALVILRRIWEDVLGVPVENAERDFFELGGDSLLALMVASRAGQAGLEMPPSGVLRQPTLRGLAEAVLDPARFENW